MPTTTIELVGLYCSGKTTFASELIAELQERGLRCPSLEKINEWRTLAGIPDPKLNLPVPGKSVRVAKIILAACWHPAATMSVTWAALRLAAVARRDWTIGRGMFKRGLLAKAVEATGKYDFVIWDEAVVSVAQTNARFTPRERIVSLLDAVNTICDPRLVYLDTDLPHVLSRARARHASGLRTKSARFLVASFLKRKKMFEAAVRGHCGDRIVRLPLHDQQRTDRLITELAAGQRGVWLIPSRCESFVNG